jgi:hypothetical protein
MRGNLSSAGIYLSSGQTLRLRMNSLHRQLFLHPARSFQFRLGS